MIRLLISGLEESIEAAPTRFRIASGASRRTVTLSMYRRALPATVTMMGTLFGYLLGGAVILEGLFGLGGMGQYLVDAVNSSDVVAMRSFLMVVAALSLTVFLLVDITIFLLGKRERLLLLLGPFLLQRSFSSSMRSFFSCVMALASGRRSSFFSSRLWSLPVELLFGFGVVLAAGQAHGLGILELLGPLAQHFDTRFERAVLDRRFFGQFSADPRGLRGGFLNLAGLIQLVRCAEVRAQPLQLHFFFEPAEFLQQRADFGDERLFLGDAAQQHLLVFELAAHTARIVVGFGLAMSFCSLSSSSLSVNEALAPCLPVFDLLLVQSFSGLAAAAFWRAVLRELRGAGYIAG